MKFREEVGRNELEEERSWKRTYMCVLCNAKVLQRKTPKYIKQEGKNDEKVFRQFHEEGMDNNLLSSFQRMEQNESLHQKPAFKERHLVFLREKRSMLTHASFFFFLWQSCRIDIVGRKWCQLQAAL